MTEIDSFDNLEEYDGIFVKLENNVPCLVKGRGSLLLNGRIIFDDSYWVKGLKYNFLSVAQLNNTCHWLEFQNRKVKIFYEEGKWIGTREKTRGNLFYLDPTTNAYLFAKFEHIWLWHKILFHANFNNMVKVSRNNKVRFTKFS